MDYERSVLDFVDRTKKNMVATDGWRAGDPSTPFYEVTNLVNSMLGLIVLPTQQMLEDMRQVKVEQHGIAEWRVAFELVPRKGSLPQELRPLLTGMRNSIAHTSLEFPSDGANISGITFVNRANNKAASILWTAEFDLDGIRAFLNPLIKEIERACRRRSRP
jgi:hypothetical protein